MRAILILLFVLLIIIISSGNTLSNHRHSHKKNIKVSDKYPSWVIRKNLVVNSKLEPRNDIIKLLIDKLEANEGIGTKVTKKEGTDPFADSSFRIQEQKRISHRKIYAIEGLAALLRYCKEKRMDPLGQKGSWGGAIGYAQFMPFNLGYAIDADSDGVINLKEWPDAIYSTANYLKVKGNYSKDIKGRRGAIFQYNRSDEYVNGVIRYSDEIYNRQLK